MSVKVLILYHFDNSKDNQKGKFRQTRNNIEWLYFLYEVTVTKTSKFSIGHVRLFGFQITHRGQETHFSFQAFRLMYMTYLNDRCMTQINTLAINTRLSDKYFEVLFHNLQFFNWF